MFTHEVLDVYTGNVLLQLASEHGRQIMGIGRYCGPACGRGHKLISHRDDFAMVGAYPGGREPDQIRLNEHRPAGVRNKVDSVPLPENDPLNGRS